MIEPVFRRRNDPDVAFEEHARGRIAPGFRADLTVLASDLRRVLVSQFPRVPVVATLVGGRFAYRASSAE